MENWEYDELFHTIKEFYEEFIEENRGYRYAAARLANEFDNLGKVEDVIADTAIGEIVMTHEKVFVGTVEGITKRLSSFPLEEAIGELSLGEVKDLSQRIERVLKGLREVTVDYNPRAE
ncbi:Imm3 family immunity protein [Priestia filamentosa]|uniref:Imm3 family immunity protein n=1 Tax=Priestia filamentosa TaxID=1402861 RepID=UPI003D26DC0C